MTSRRNQCKTIASLDHIKCTYDADWGEFRVTMDGLSREREEAVAYYTDDYGDALGTAQHMSQFRVRELAMAGVNGEGKVKYQDTIY